MNNEPLTQQQNQALEAKLQQQLEQLPKTLTPSRDLWAGIDHAIEQQQQQGYRHPRQGLRWVKLSAVAAGFAVIGLTGWLTLNSGVSDDGLGDTTGGHLVFVDEMSTSFEQQKQALLVKYQDQQQNSQNWRSQLKELDAAAAAIKKALDQDPSNAQLIKMLQQTYQQQLDLIKAVNKSPWHSI